MAKRILDVGQCGVDGPRISQLLTHLGYHVDRAHSKDEALKLAAERAYDLVLVNRILDRDRSPGLAVIAALRAAHPPLCVMLISDREDAQAQAEMLGAIPGFGKYNLESDETEAAIRAALETKEHA